MYTYYYGGGKKSYILWGFAYLERMPDGSHKIRPRWSRVLSLFAITGVIAWLSISTFLYFFFKHKRNFEAVQFHKMMVLPLRYGKHRNEMGEYYIERGNQALEEKELRTAFSYLRSGLGLAPYDIKARRTVSEFYLAYLRRPSTAVNVLEQGLEYDPGYEYLSYFYKVLISYQFDDKTIEISKKLLPTTTEPKDKQLILTALATALHLQGSYQEALRVIEEHELEKIPDGLSLFAQIKWGQGQFEEAISILEQCIQRYPGYSSAYDILDVFLRERQEYDKSRKYAILHSTVQPLSHKPRIALLYSQQLSGQTEKAQQSVDRFMKDFSRDDNALKSLAAFAADNGLTQVSQFLYDKNASKDPEAQDENFLLLHLNALINNQDSQKTLDLLAQLKEDNYQWLPQNEAIINSVLAIAYRMQEQRDLALFHYEQFEEDKSVRAETLYSIAKTFERLGYQDYSLSAAQEAVERANENQRLLSYLVQMKLETNQLEDIGSNLLKLLQMRRPTYKLLSQAFTTLSGDQYIFSPHRDEVLERLHQMLFQDQEEDKKVAHSSPTPRLHKHTL